jgi:hypothetical protein
VALANGGQYNPHHSSTYLTLQDINHRPYYREVYRKINDAMAMVEASNDSRFESKSKDKYKGNLICLCNNTSIRPRLPNQHSAPLS